MDSKLEDIRSLSDSSMAVTSGGRGFLGPSGIFLCDAGSCKFSDWVPVRSVSVSARTHAPV